jgi:hypothetical protein
MRNETGSAIMVVLLFMAVVSMLGVGLLLQTKLDVRFTSSVQGMEKIASLADAGSTTSFKTLPSSVPATQGSNPVVYVPLGSTTGGITSVQVPTSGTYSYYAIYVGGAPNQLIPGYGVESTGYGGGSFYAAYWIGEGLGQQASDDKVQARVQIGAVKPHQN